MSNSPKRLTFQVYNWPLRGTSKTWPKACLIDDNWDDYTFKTLFSLIVFDEDGVKREIGNIKIAKFGMEDGPARTDLPATFERLDDEYFSLGQGDSYYEALNELTPWIKEAILSNLHDVAFDLDLWKRARVETVTSISLLRSFTRKSVEGQFRRLVQGGARLTEYDFTYVAPKRVTGAPGRLKLSFLVKPESYPPTNIHVLIGRNGAGKTHILQLMTKALVGKRAAAPYH